MFPIASRLLLFNYLLPFKLRGNGFPLIAQRTLRIDPSRHRRPDRGEGDGPLHRLDLLAFGLVLLADGEAHSSWRSPLLTGTGFVVSVLIVVGPDCWRRTRRSSRRLRRKIPCRFEQLVSLAASSRPVSQRLLALALRRSPSGSASASLAAFAGESESRLNVLRSSLHRAHRDSSLFTCRSASGGLGPPQAAPATPPVAGRRAQPVPALLASHGVIS